MSSEKTLNKTCTEYLNLGGTFKDITNIDTNSMESMYTVGYNLYKAEKYDKAKNIFQFLSFYDHYNHKFFLGLASCFMMKQNYKKAIELFQYVTILDKNNPKVFLHMADCYLNIGKNKEAITLYKKVVTLAKNKKEFKKDWQRASGILKNFQAS